MVPDCTLVHTNRGPTPLKHPARPSVLYIILKPVITDEVSNIAAPCAFNVVEGEEVEMGRLWVGCGLLDFSIAACLDEDV